MQNKLQADWGKHNLENKKVLNPNLFPKKKRKLGHCYAEEQKKRGEQA